MFLLVLLYTQRILMEIKLDLPIYWINEKKTKSSTTHLVGANFFRNCHFHVKNKLKQDYHSMVADLLDSTAISIDGPYTVEYRIYYKNPSCDGSNIVGIIEKFFLDAIQDLDIVQEDNVKFHLGSTWSIAGQDRTNPRCEITLKS